MTARQSHSQHPPSVPHLPDACSVQGLVLVRGTATKPCSLARKINIPKWDNKPDMLKSQLLPSDPTYSQGWQGGRGIRVQSQPGQLNETLKIKGGGLRIQLSCRAFACSVWGRAPPNHAGEDDPPSTHQGSNRQAPHCTDHTEPVPGRCSVATWQPAPCSRGLQGDSD